MSQETPSSSRSFLIALVLTMALWALPAWPSGPDDEPEGTAISAPGAIVAVSTPLACELPSSSPGSPSTATPGMQVYRDPVTGRFGQPPPGALPDVAIERRAQPLVEKVITAVPGGGVRVGLAGRFTSALVVTRRPDASFEITCSQGLHPPSDAPPTREGGDR